MKICEKLRLGGCTIHLKCTRLLHTADCGADGAQWFTTNTTGGMWFYCRCDAHRVIGSSPYARFNSLDDVKAHIAMREL